MKISEAIKLASDKQHKPDKIKPNWAGGVHPTSNGLYISNGRGVVVFMTLLAFFGFIAVIVAAFV